MVTCPRCKIGISSADGRLDEHEEECARLPVPATLRRIYEDGGEARIDLDRLVTLTDLCNFYGVGSGIVRKHLMFAGMDTHDIDTTERLRIAAMGYARCAWCRILITDDIDSAPNGWTYQTNGRVGDYCYACSIGK